jgi:hypothetical protein
MCPTRIIFAFSSKISGANSARVSCTLHGPVFDPAKFSGFSPTVRLSSARTRRLELVLEAWLQLDLEAESPVVTIPLMLQYVEDCLDLDEQGLDLHEQGLLMF